MAIFNKEQLLIMSANDEELASQVAGVFLNDIPRQFETLQKALERGDAKQAERTVHSIKGASATVGGEELRETAFQGEQHARAGDLDKLAAMIPEIEKQFALLKVELEAAGYQAMNVDA